MARFKVTARLEVSRRSMLIITVFAYAVSPLVVLAVLAAAGRSPVVALDALYRGTIGTTAGFAESIVQGTSLMLLSLGLAIAFRGKVWNIGAEGQQVFGAIVVTWFVLLAFGGSNIRGYTRPNEIKTWDQRDHNHNHDDLRCGRGIELACQRSVPRQVHTRQLS